MAVTLSVEDVIGVIRSTGLIESKRFEKFLTTLNQTSTISTDPIKFVGKLVRDQLLTTYQAKLLLTGRKSFHLGKYKLLDLLGSGGNGSVFLCEHEAMQRRVAVKLLPPDRVKDPSYMKRFYREARAAASLDHPNIVRAFDIDNEGDKHFLVMEYIDGASLQQLVAREGVLAVDRAVNYICQAAEGLHHLYQQKMVHRDIKPSNIMVDLQGLVKIADMGLALMEKAPDNITRELDKDAVMGTVDYMAPEQALSSHDVDWRADIFSLGATLYYILAGQPPFEGDTMAQKLLSVQLREPTPLSARRKDVPEGLENVLRRMMAKQVSSRYQTPAEVVAALRPWLAEALFPANSKSDSMSGSMSESGSFKSARLTKSRIPSIDDTPSQMKQTGSTVRTTKSLQSMDGVEIVDEDDTPSSRSQATTRTVRSSRPEDSTRIRERVDSGPATMRSKSTKLKKKKKKKGGNASPLLFAIGGGVLIAGFVVGAIFFMMPKKQTLREKKLLAEIELAERTGDVSKITIKEDEKKTGQAVGGSDDTGSAVTLRSNQVISSLGSPINFVAIAPNGDTVAIAGVDGNVRKYLRNTSDQRHTSVFAHQGGTLRVRFSRDSQMIISTGRDMSVAVWRVADLTPVVRFVGGHTKPVTSADMTENGKLVVSGDEEGKVFVWDPEKTKPVVTFADKHTSTINGVIILPGSKRVVTADNNGLVIEWELESGKPVGEFKLETGVSGLGLHPAKKILAFGREDGKVTIWEHDSGPTALRHIEGHKGAVVAAAFSPGGATLSTASKDGTARLWDWGSGEQLAQTPKSRVEYTGVCFSHGGDALITTSLDARMLRWPISG